MRNLVGRSDIRYKPGEATTLVGPHSASFPIQEWRRRYVRMIEAIIVCLAICAITSCSKSKDRKTRSGDSRIDGSNTVQPVAEGTHVINGHTISEAEFRYGLAATRNDKVVYQDDVVIVDGGANSIRSQSSNGITWTIDPSAGHANEIRTGGIVFITSRAAGRVLGVRSTDQGLEVTLGPFELTDLIKEIDVSSDQRIAPAEMISYSALSFPGIMAEPLHSQQPAGEPTLKPSSFNFFAPGQTGFATGTASGLPGMGPPAQIDINNFKILPYCCGGFGMEVAYDAADVKIKSYAVLRLLNPSLHFNLVIHGGKLQKANVELEGAAGQTMQFEAGSAVGASGNLRRTFMSPVDLSIPIFGLPVPLAVTLHQSFTIITGFSAKNSTIRAVGDYSFNGSLYAGYQNGSWGVGAPTSFTVRQSLLQSIDGIALGPEGLVMAYQAKAIVGIGAFGFVTGPYFGYNAGIGTTRNGEAIGVLGAPCRTADLSIEVVGGVGYMIPQVVTSVINSFLRALNMKQISNFGGLEHREKLISKHDSLPHGCA